MEDLFSNAAIARVARITTAEEPSEEPDEAGSSGGDDNQLDDADKRSEEQEEQRGEQEKETEKAVSRKQSSSASKAPAGSATKAHKFKRKHQDDNGSRTIFVGNVPATIKKKKLKQFFKYEPHNTWVQH